MHLNKAFILSLACFIFSPTLHAAAPSGDSIGRVIITTTNLVAKQTDGSTRALRNASRIYQGDTLITGNDGMAQLRLYDGSVFSLRKATEFKIAEYSFNLEQEPEERGLFNLIRGGFRTITGLLGKRPNSSYKVTTTAATIGIRGTHYGLRLCQNGDCKDEGINQDGLYGAVIDGEIIAENQFGNNSFSNDEYFFVAGWDSQPLGMLAPPGVVFGADKTGGKVKNKKKVNAGTKSAANSTPEAAQRIGRQIRKMIHDNRQQGENLNASNLLTPAPKDSVAAVGMLIMNGANMEGKAPAIKASPDVGPSNGLVLLRPNKSLGAIAWKPAGAPPFYVQATPETEFRNLGTKSGMGVSWGRWDTKWDTTNGAGSHNQVAAASAHYIMSNNITPTAAIPLTGSVNLTNVIGGTKPTDHLGNLGHIQSVTMDVVFGTSTTDITGYNVTMRFGINEIISLDAGLTDLNIASKGEMNLSGFCSGTARCTGAGNPVVLSGKASVNLIGATANTVMTSFSASGTGDLGSVGYSGTALVTE